MTLLIVSASFLDPLLGNARENLRGSEALAEKVGLNPRFFDDPSGFIPAHSALEFARMTMLRYGDNSDLYKKGQVGAGRGAVSSVIMNEVRERSTIALDLIRTYLSTLSMGTNAMYLDAVIDQELLWIRFRRADFAQRNDPNIIFLSFESIRLHMRKFFGTAAMVQKVMMPKTNQHSFLPAFMQGLEVVSRGDQMGLAYSTSLLTRDIVPDPALLKPLERTSWEKLTGSHINQLVDTAKYMILGEETDRLSRRMAHGFGMSTSRYLSELSELGMTHRELVRMARSSAAIDLIRNPNLSITEIAFETGFRNPGDFSRFFKQQSGLSPSAYRKLMRQ